MNALPKTISSKVKKIIKWHVKNEAIHAYFTFSKKMIGFDKLINQNVKLNSIYDFTLKLDMGKEILNPLGIVFCIK